MASYDKYLFMVTKYGIEELIGEKYLNNMPAYKDILSDKEIISGTILYKKYMASYNKKNT